MSLSHRKYTDDTWSIICSKIFAYKILSAGSKFFFSFSVSVCLCMFQASKDNLQYALEDYSLWSEGSESVTSVGMWFPVISGSGMLDL